MTNATGEPVEVEGKQLRQRSPKAKIRAGWRRA